MAENSSKDMMKILTKRVSSQDSALIHALKTVYFLVKQNIPNHQYPDFVDFLVMMGCDAFAPLNVAANSTYP